MWSFNHALSGLPPLFAGPETAVFNYEDEFHLQPQTLRHPDRKPLTELSSPFVYVYHDRGGHLPYDNPFEDYENMRRFFDSYSDATTLKQMYEQSVEDSGRRFVELLDELRDRDQLESTLVVYVSDHGELLGEYGNLFTHAVPMVPELVEIPIVFAGAGLPSGEEYDALLSGTDVGSTALGALGRSPPRSADGTDLWNERPTDDRLVRSEVWKQTRYEYLQSYIAGSVWDRNGGYVCHRRSRLHRLAYSFGVHFVKGPHAPLTRSATPKDYLSLFRAHLPTTCKYGEPGFEDEEARRLLPPFERATDQVEVEADQERLKSLGYLE